VLVSPSRTALVPAALLGLALLAGCGSDTADPASARPASPSPSPSPTPTCVPAALERRAAAVLVVGIPGVTTAEDALGQSVVDLGVGGLFLSEPNVESAQQVRALVDGLRARAGRPLLVSTDEESGRVAVTREIVGAGPSPRRLALERTPEEVRQFAAELGARLAEVGIDVDLAPLLDLDAGPSGGIVGDRSFSADPELAAAYGLAFSVGLTDAGVTPTVKHFPGQGRSTTDTHATGAVVDAGVEELRGTDLLPFQRAIDAGVPVVMLNHLGYRALDADLPASVSPEAYALLREMGFEGVAMTDSLGMGAINLRWDFPEAAVRAIEAGADAALATDGNQAVRMRDALVEAVRTGRLPEERLSEAAARVTALAGGDPEAMSCLDVTLPSLAAASDSAGAPSASTVPAPTG
jgi:beta-N-acetylhexosaminidase